MARGFKAVIDRNGAVLLGTSLACDASADRPLRIVTHGHSDHIRGLSESLRRCQKVIMTPATHDLIRLLYGFPPARETVLHTLDYGDTLEFGEDTITLFRAGHILGSAEVLVEDDEGTRLVYTGDFKLPEAEIIPSDVLVIEATYGNPSNRRPFKDEVEAELVTLIRASLKKGPVCIFGYHGKIQEVIRIVRQGGIDAPIIVPKRIYEVTKLYEEREGKIGDYYQSGTAIAKEAMKQLYIGMYHLRSAGRFTEKGTKIYLSGWEFEHAWKTVGEDEYLVALSDHSDFDELIAYVEESHPKFVVTDNYRVGDAVTLAHEIQKRLGIPASPMP
ncbi:MAG: MBL fold metallo-hydrolase [Methanophagales archaeon ANME-1-THS]|nr:MAG: MBL fold metallo-hydrolase [Methanophagales archaeon ANME-1-THS]